MNINGKSQDRGFNINITYEGHTKNFSYYENYIPHSTSTLNKYNINSVLLLLLQVTSTALLIIIHFLIPNILSLIELIILSIPVCLICTTLIIHSRFPYLSKKCRQWHYLEHQIVEYVGANSILPTRQVFKKYNPYGHGCSSNINTKDIIDTLTLTCFLILIPLILYNAGFIIIATFILIIYLNIRMNITPLYSLFQKKFFLAKPDPYHYHIGYQVLEEIYRWLNVIKSQSA